MSRKLIIAIAVILALLGIGFLAHSFDLLGFFKSLHGGTSQAH
jgi:hypothetical protein